MISEENLQLGITRDLEKIGLSKGMNCYVTGNVIALAKLGIKKNSIFFELETFSKNTDYSFYIHDISLYPLLFLNMD